MKELSKNFQIDKTTKPSNSNELLGFVIQSMNLLDHLVKRTIAAEFGWVGIRPANRLTHSNLSGSALTVGCVRTSAILSAPDGSKTIMLAASKEEIATIS
jgi:hypothetical protein